MRNYILILITALFITSCGGGGGDTVSGASVKEPSKPVIPKNAALLSWTTPTLYVDGTPLSVAGYRIYYGKQSGIYTKSIDVAVVNSYTVTNLDSNEDYYFAITVFDSNGIESDLSNEQAKSIL